MKIDMPKKISLNVAENVIWIIENVVKGEKTRTVWECQTEYDQRQLSVYRSELLDAVGYLSHFCMPDIFRKEIERIYEKTHGDHWILPVPTMQPPTHLLSGVTTKEQPETIDTIQKHLMEDVIVQDGWTYIMLATHLQAAGMLRYTNVGEKFHHFFEGDRKNEIDTEKSQGKY